MKNENKIYKKIYDKKGISAILVLYNEERKIELCLKSICDVVDEIVVIHDGPCLDNTLKICEEYGCKIFIRNHIGEAEPHRPFALTKCLYDWVLFIDGDERLSTSLKKRLRKKINSKYDAYSFKFVTKINGVKNKFMSKQILFKKNKIYYIGLPHIQPETRGLIKDDFSILEHDSEEFKSSKNLLIKYLKKDREWGKISAKILYGPLNKIPVYNCNLKDNTLKQIKKIKFMRKFPFIAIFLFPTYSFLNNFIKKKMFLEGFLGFALSCHIPLHSFFTGYYLCLYKLRIIKDENSIKKTL